MAETQKRLGFGEPVTLSGEEADLIRLLLERRAGYINVINNPWTYGNLLRLFIPFPEVCAPTRSKLNDIEAYFGNVEGPEEHDPEQDVIEARLNGALNEFHDTFKAKPEGCEMTSEGDDCYACRRCNFRAAID